LVGVELAVVVPVGLEGGGGHVGSTFLRA
jgi:hypothetical protein